MLNSKSSRCLLCLKILVSRLGRRQAGTQGLVKELVKVQKGFSGVKAKCATVAERPSHPCVLLVWLVWRYVAGSTIKKIILAWMRGQGQHLVEGWLRLKCPTKTGLLSFTSTSFYAPVKIHLWYAVVLCVYLHIWPLEGLEFRKSLVRSPRSQTFFDNIACHHQLIAHVSQWVKAAYVWLNELLIINIISL